MIHKRLLHWLLVLGGVGVMAAGAVLGHLAAAAGSAGDMPDVSAFAWALVGAILIAVFLPHALRFGEGMLDKNGKPVGPWTSLLSESTGGFSLSRVQLLLWFLPIVVLYAALCASLRKFASMDTNVALLLGLSGATGAVGTAASPAQTDRAVAAQGGIEPPSLNQLVQDWNGNGDVSRYQYLLLSLLGVVAMIVSFFQEMQFPAIPKELLYVVGASQATYVGTKAVKASQQ